MALGGGGALYLIGHNLFRFRDTGTVSVPRFVVAAGACLTIPLAMHVFALVSLSGLMILFVGELTRRQEDGFHYIKVP